jgi:hypothetical protein
MNLIELAEELTKADIIELFARKALLGEQEYLRTKCNDVDLSEKDVRVFRNTLANSQALSEFVVENLSVEVYDTLIDDINTKVADLAEEYTRDV